jgi:hypothetical protein
MFEFCGGRRHVQVTQPRVSRSANEQGAVPQLRYGVAVPKGARLPDGLYWEPHKTYPYGWPQSNGRERHPDDRREAITNPARWTMLYEG